MGYRAEGISALLSGGQYELAVAFQEDSGVESQMAVTSVSIELGIAGALSCGTTSCTQRLRESKPKGLLLVVSA